MYNHELMHTGVKGMRWGHRKDPYSGYNRIPRPGAVARKAGKAVGVAAKKASKSAVSYAKKKAYERKNPPINSKTLKKKSAVSMSDEELNRAINRLKKEKEYNTLMKELNPEKKSVGKEAVKKFMNDTPEKISNELSTQLSKQISSSLFGDTNNKNKNKQKEAEEKKKKDDQFKKDQSKRAIGKYLKGDSTTREFAKDLAHAKLENEYSRQKRLVAEKLIENLADSMMNEDSMRKRKIVTVRR